MRQDKTVDFQMPTEAAPPRMVKIPEGSTVIGTTNRQIMSLIEAEEWAEDWQDKGLFRVEQPAFKIKVPEFNICAHPVSNVEYNFFVWEKNYKPPKYWNGFRFPEGMSDHPVVGVSREDAEMYCAWISEELGMTFRLPTEIEWERASRGDDGRIYPWGDVFDPWRCNTLESGKKSTTPIGSYSPSGDSPFGVWDMVGNVWEWTSSYLRPYPYKIEENQINLDPSWRCVVRGGAWYYSKKLARCSAREGVIPSYISTSLGFRLASDKDEMPQSDTPPTDR